MRSLFEVYESIADSDEQVDKKTTASYFIDSIVGIINSYYDSSAKFSDENKSLLEKLWKEHDLEIPGCEWWFTRYRGIVYAPKAEFPAEVVRLFKDGEDYLISLHSRAGVDSSIRDIAITVSDSWAKKVKQAAKKLTDAFLRKYDKKLSNVLNMKSVEDKGEYFISVYELD